MTLAVDIAASFSAPGAAQFEIESSFTVDRGETVAILGPSGSGKTLMLETVAGFHSHTGSVTLDGRELSGAEPENRDFGFVFQDYALFPHMTVTENVRYGERYCEETGDLDTLVSRLDIADLLDRYPPTLSGGEKQRVALARSLYVQPAVLLLDEPLSSLDVPTRERLRSDMADILADVTSVYVTHDRTTARMLADRILVVEDGAIVQRGTPEEIFEQPTSPFVARFTGSNCISLATAGIRDAVGAANGANWLAVRPEHVTFVNEEPDLTATVERVVRVDSTFRVSLSVDGESIDAHTTDPPETGSSVGISFNEAAQTLL
jgi:ABC-type Fe3+/spermidine/putrescine transport system ATPase subunit